MPPSLPTAQGRGWYAALDAATFAAASSSDYYEDLAERGLEAQSVEHMIVEKDIGRTFPERPAFQSPAARTRLRRVLGAYALRNTYCQGMSYVAALMLQHLPERDAFWALAALVEAFLPSGYFTDDLHGAYMDQHIAFATFLPHLLPRLSRHLAQLEFPLTLIGVRWFLCLFAADMEPECTARLWDVLFAHGAHVLFSLALGLLAEHEERLLIAADVPELFLAVRTIGRAAPSYREVRERTQGFPSEADVQVARAAYRRVNPPPQKESAAEDAEADAPAVDDAAAANAPAADDDADIPDVEDAVAASSDAEKSQQQQPTTAMQVTAAAPSSSSARAEAPRAAAVVVPPRPEEAARLRAKEAIAAAMADVHLCQRAADEHDDERRAALEAERTARELTELIGGDEALKALRKQLVPEEARGGRKGAQAGGADDEESGIGQWWAAALRGGGRLLEGLRVIGRGSSDQNLVATEAVATEAASDR